MLRYVAAILPPKEIAEQIVKALEGKKSNDTFFTVNPHIRAAFREGLDPYPGWEEVITKVASEAQPFQVEFGKPELLGEYKIILPIKSQGIIDLHRKAVELMFKSDKHGQQSEDELTSFLESQNNFIPHITLATGIFKSSRERQKIFKDVSRLLSDLPAFTASELVTYEALVFDHSYEAKSVVALGKPGASFQPAVGLDIITLF